VLSAPVVAAPMAGGPSTPALVAAVGDVGGLGFLGAGYKPAADVAAEIAATRALSSQPFGVNLFVPGTPSDVKEVAAYREQLRGRYAVEPGEPRWDDDEWEAKLAVVAGVAVVSFAFGCPSPEVVSQLRDRGSAVAVTVTTAAEAEAAGDVDVLVLQGAEAGGHRGSWADDEDPPLPLRALLASTRTDVPRWAAGGLMTRTDVAAVLEQGAAAAVLGTAFLLCLEAGTHPTHRAALLDRRFTETALTRAFTGRTARGLENDFLREHPDAPRGYPEIHHVTRPIRQASAAAGDPQALHLWAGTGWRQCQAIPAGELVTQLRP
jgi:nitronate monooxygenase